LLGWVEIALWCSAVALFAGSFAGRMQPYRSLLRGAGILLLTTSLLPRPGNVLGQYLFGSALQAPRLPTELFGIAWWLLGAWLLNSLLSLVLSRTLFPRDNEPHARRLFADLAAGVIYLVAFAGIMETVFRQPMSTVLATSGVVAIVLGFALQSTLGDVLSGLAINIDRPFGAGDWIAVHPDIEGEVVEINWRSTRLRTWLSELIVVPNSVVAKATVTNHTWLAQKHRCAVYIKIDHSISPGVVIGVLESAANSSSGASAPVDARAYAIDFSKSLITYELAFMVDEFVRAPALRSEVIQRVADALRSQAIPIGIIVTDIRILRGGPLSVPEQAQQTLGHAD
jgi:small-conductance mechanosensitive channel